MKVAEYSELVCPRCRGRRIEEPGVVAIRRPCRSCGGRGTLPVGKPIWMPALGPYFIECGALVIAGAWQCSVCWTRVVSTVRAAVQDRGGGKAGGPPEECPNCGAVCAVPDGAPLELLDGMLRAVGPALRAGGWD